MCLSNFTITNKIMMRTTEVSILASVIFLAALTLQAPQDTPALPALPGDDQLFPLPIAITKNNQFMELPYIGKEYSVSFEFFINKMPTEVYQTIIHLTTGENCCGMGSRIPAVWAMSSKEFLVASGVSGNGNLFKKFPGMEENKWYKLEINQKLVDAKVVNTDFELRYISTILVHVRSDAGWCKHLVRRKYHTY